MTQNADMLNQCDKIHRDRRLAAWIFGGLTLLVIIYIVLFGPKELPPYRHQSLGILCAVLCGLFAYFFTGTIEVGGEMLGIKVRAAGGVAFFVLVLFWWHSDVAPIKEVKDDIQGARQDIQLVVSLLEKELRIDHGTIASLMSKVAQNGPLNPTQRAIELAKQIPGSADDYTLALKSLVMRGIINKRQADALQVANSDVQSGSLHADHQMASGRTQVDYSKFDASSSRQDNGFRDEIVIGSPTPNVSWAQIGPLDSWITITAWEAYNTNSFQLAISNATACVRQFQAAARIQQQDVQASGLIPPIGEPKDEKEKKETQRRGPLNAVATCWFIKGESYEKLAEIKDHEKPDLDALQKARDAYTATLEYSHGRCWDTNGFFWSPAQVSRRERLPEIERTLSSKGK
jgi:hypothetical protein